MPSVGSSLTTVKLDFDGDGDIDGADIRVFIKILTSYNRRTLNFTDQLFELVGVFLHSEAALLLTSLSIATKSKVCWHGTPKKMRRRLSFQIQHNSR